ncbi:MAG: prephenate dehydrogenase/arogenate dehydrogenase family protein [Candidatus Omnitrophota bacterium]
MKLFRKVAIVGTGLIGGSIALAIKRHGLAECVVGVSRHKETILRAKKRGMIDEGSQDLRIIKNADLLVIATPVRTIEKLASAIARLVPGHCIVIDVGSAKEAIAERFDKVFTRYVGTHPLAGSEKRGVAHAEAGLFKDSLCILTPTRKTDTKALRAVKKLWRSIGADTVEMSPSAHDKMLAFISHLPHVVAFCLMAAIPAQFLRYAPASLKEATRVAASDSILWSDILLSNSGNIIRSVGVFERMLSRVKSAAKRNRAKLLERIFKDAKFKRELLDGYRNRRSGGRR